MVLSGFDRQESRSMATREAGLMWGSVALINRGSRNMATRKAGLMWGYVALIDGGVGTWRLERLG